MNVKIKYHTDKWQEIKNAAMNTIGKKEGKYPDSKWKRRLLLSEHSPIRKLNISWIWTGLKYWVSVHLVRHKFGIEHFISTQRDDLVQREDNISRDEIGQGALVNHECEANAQAIINISRKRLCFKASPETRQAWQEVKNSISVVEPELAECMVKECVYRNGLCPEMKSCGYNKSDAFKHELKKYLELSQENICDETNIFKNSEVS